MIKVHFLHNYGQFKDRCWCAYNEVTQEAHDYGTLKYLEDELQKDGLDYRIQTQHRDGSVSYRKPNRIK